MNELGLAAQQQGQMPEVNPMQAVGQIVAMLRQGMTPEELVQRGVPQELVAEAMRVLSQETTAVPQEGLAGMATRGEM